MIQFKTGDILAEDAEALVNTVNCVGVMGRGIALQFKKAFPENFAAYRAACRREEVRTGSMFVFETGRLAGPRYIINFPTKRHWRGKSRMEDIEAGLRALVEEIRERGIRSIAVPPLGSGLGGLEWDTVRRRIEATLADLDGVDAVVFEPSDAPAAKRAVRDHRAPQMTAGRAALVGLMDQYRNSLLDPFISLLEVHKLLYFMQGAGEPLKLKFEKGSHGPYATNLRHVLHRIEGHFISGYGDGGDAPDKRLELVPGAIENAEAFLHRCPDTRERFCRVADLVEGFESSFGLELLATVHWVLEHEAADAPDDVITRTYAWNERKKRFSREQIKLAADVLTEKSWTGGATATEHR